MQSLDKPCAIYRVDHKAEADNELFLGNLGIASHYAFFSMTVLL